MTLSGTTSASQLNTDFDAQTSTLTTNAVAGQKDRTIFVFLASMTSSTAIGTRTVAWTQQDDQELRIIFARGTADATDSTLTATLTVDNGDTAFLNDNTVSVSVAQTAGGVFDTRTGTSAATANAHGDYRNATPTATDVAARMKLLKGVRYRLTMSTDAGTWTSVEACIQLRSVRRRS